MASGEIVIREGAVLTGEENADMQYIVPEEFVTSAAQVLKYGRVGRPAILAWRIVLLHMDTETGEHYSLAWRVHVDDVVRVIRYDSHD